ncbi:MAG: hypothetical protein QME79_13965 [Bacillota bacterium]|nr:hypothetical protein [Bacillota bacterium]
MHALNHAELRFLLKTNSLRGLGRLAASPDTEIPHIVASMSSGYGGGLAFEYRSKGVSIWTGTNRPWNSEPDHHITWTQIRRHISRYVTEDFTNAFRETDRKWCHAKVGDQTPGALYCHTDAERETIADLEAQLRLLAAPIWEPATTIEGEPEQLDLFA